MDYESNFNCGTKNGGKSVRPLAKTLSLSAEAIVTNGPNGERAVALVFGPENGAVSEALVANAAKEANAKNYARLYVVGFAIQAAARQFVEDCEKIAGVPATYVQATPDLVMGDLLKNMRSSQLFSVCGLPDVRVFKGKGKENAGKWQVELLGLDVFDPATLEAHHLAGAVSAPFEAGETGKVAVKVIDDRGNELMVVKDLK